MDRARAARPPGRLPPPGTAARFRPTGGPLSLPRLQELVGNRVVANLVATPRDKATLPVQRQVQDVNAWLVAQANAAGPGGAVVPAAVVPTRALLSTYLSQVVRPEIARAVAADKPAYGYLGDLFNAAAQALPRGGAATAAALTTYVAEHLDVLVETANVALAQIDADQQRAQQQEQERTTGAAAETRRRVNEGDGGYPVGHIDGAGETTTLVVSNTVLPDLDGHRYVVWLEHHQNKHQVDMIPQLGRWGSKMGTRFAGGEGLAWHTANTAGWARDWIRANERNVPADGTTYSPNKTTTVDANDITYDLKAWREGETVHISYHCNPKAHR